MSAIDRNILAQRIASEEARFVESHPKSLAAAKAADGSLLGGVPMPWMKRWPGAFPISVTEARGAKFVDVDGHCYTDFCLGDTGAMTGHAVDEITSAITAQLNRGSTVMLPSADSTWVGQELTRRFGLPKWQFSISATDANRFVLRLARHLTGRPKVLVHDWCYHGTVDETLVIADEHGKTISRHGAIGPQVHPSTTTRVVPFNDLDALEKQLGFGDVACMLIEPALTNIGIVLPEPGYLAGVRELTRKHGVILIIDETHTICAGPGGATRFWNLEPDMLVIGKTIGGGIPVAAYGMSDALAAQAEKSLASHDVDVSGLGGTLAGSVLAMAAARATLSHALLPEQFEKTIRLATRWAEGVAASIRTFDLDWSVQQLGCRAEYWFCQAPKNGAQAAAGVDPELENFMHLWALNRGVLLTPFHNMALLSSFHTEQDIDEHTNIFASAVAALVG
jgi:glutamate-1-semialdehyde 2,1-aminomutase